MSIQQDNIDEKLLILARKELDIERAAFIAYKEQAEAKLALDRHQFKLEVHEHAVKQAQQQFEHDKQDIHNFFAPLTQAQLQQQCNNNDIELSSLLPTTLLTPTPSFIRQSSHISQQSIAGSETHQTTTTTPPLSTDPNHKLANDLTVIAHQLTPDELLAEIEQFRDMKYQFELNLQRTETDLLKRMFQVQKIEAAIKADCDILLAKSHKIKLREADLIKKEDLLQLQLHDVEKKEQEVNKILNEEIGDFHKWKKQSFVDGIMATLQTNHKAWKAVTEQPTIRFLFTNLNKQLILFYDSQTSSMSAADSVIADTHKFFRIDHNNGLIPDNWDNHKLFFSSIHVKNGDWIQIAGPGCQLDPSRVYPLTFCDFHDRFSRQSHHDSDRCQLTKQECQAKGCETNAPYKTMHMDPKTEFVYHYDVKIKWEKD